MAETSRRSRGGTAGLMAEFESASALLGAARAAHAAGFRRMEAYSPFPIDGLREALGARPTWLPLFVLGGGLTGLVAGAGLQYWASAVNYPLNIGGRPLNSWPAFVPVTFELTVLAAALTAVIGMLLLNGLPQLHHPIFEAPGFDRASRDRFFLMIEGGDLRADVAGTRAFLEQHGALAVSEVDT